MGRCLAFRTYIVKSSPKGSKRFKMICLFPRLLEKRLGSFLSVVILSTIILCNFFFSGKVLLAKY